jgi:DNA-binding MarR family transcriptional regulator
MSPHSLQARGSDPFQHSGGRAEPPLRAAYTESGAALFELLRVLEACLPVLFQAPVSQARMAVLRTLALQGPSNLSEIARLRGVARQGVQRLAEAMEAEGLVRSRPDPRTRRPRVLELTERGAAEYQRLTALEARALNASAQGFTPSEFRTASRLLHRLAERLRSPAARSPAVPRGHAAGSSGSSAR